MFTLVTAISSMISLSTLCAEIAPEDRYLVMKDILGLCTNISKTLGSFSC